MTDLNITSLNRWKIRRCMETMDRYNCLEGLYNLDDIIEHCRYCSYQTNNWD